MTTTHDYDTKTMKPSDLDETHVLVGESGGLSAVYTSAPSELARGFHSVTTEHGWLLLDSGEDVDVYNG